MATWNAKCAEHSKLQKFLNHVTSKDTTMNKIKERKERKKNVNTHN